MTLPSEQRAASSKQPGTLYSTQQRILLSIEGSAKVLVATATAAVLPVHLDEPVVTGKRLIVFRAVARGGKRTPYPGALIGVLLAAGVIPCIQVWIGVSLFRFMRHNRRHAIRAAVIVGAGGLGFTG